MKIATVGIDVSMNDFQVCFSIQKDDNTIKVLATKSFKNTDNGAQEMLLWVKKHNKQGLKVKYLMEATGCYYENLAYFLYNNGEVVGVVLANKMKNYFKSLNVKTKTDKVDAKIIAQYGIERNIESWEPMSANYKTIRDLTRELLTQKKESTRVKNQLHAINHSHDKHNLIKELKTKQVEFHQQMIEQIREEIIRLVDLDTQLKEKINKVITIPGIGFETAIILVCETNGFELFSNIRQVVSYAGLDVSHNESGKFKGKSRISKKGNSRIRQALYMPGVAATWANEPIKKLYERVCEKNPNIKRKGVVASMRKLLMLVFILWKKDEVYNESYKWSA